MPSGIEVRELDEREIRALIADMRRCAAQDREKAHGRIPRQAQFAFLSSATLAEHWAYQLEAILNR